MACREQHVEHGKHIITNKRCVLMESRGNGAIAEQNLREEFGRQLYNLRHVDSRMDQPQFRAFNLKYEAFITCDEKQVA